MKSLLRFPAFMVAAAAVPVAALAPLAAADAVYHSEHLDLAPVGSAPLRSGFVQNIKAEGPNVYAHEVFVLNGAVPNARTAAAAVSSGGRTSSCLSSTVPPWRSTIAFIRSK